MYGVTEYTLLFVLLIEVCTYFKRNSALTELMDCISRLNITHEVDANFIVTLANYSTNPKKQFFFMVLSPWIVYKMSKQHDKKDFNVEKNENYNDFIKAIKLNIIVTSPTMFFITTAIHLVISILILVMSILTYFVFRSHKQHTIRDNVIDNVIDRYAH